MPTPKTTFIRTVLRLREAENYKPVETAIHDKRGVGENGQSPGGLWGGGIEKIS